MLAIKLLNDQATLNNFYNVSSRDYIPGDAFTLNFQIFDSQTKQRFMADADATIEVVFQKNDGSELTVEADVLFETDRSMWSVEMTAESTETIVGANFMVVMTTEVDEEDVIVSGMAYNALSKITFDGEC